MLRLPKKLEGSNSRYHRTVHLFDGLRADCLPAVKMIDPFGIGIAGLDEAAHGGFRPGGKRSVGVPGMSESRANPGCGQGEGGQEILVGSGLAVVRFPGRHGQVVMDFGQVK